MTPTQWTPGLVVLGVGGALAAGYLLMTRRAGGPAPASGAKDDLSRRYENLLTQLRELGQERHQLGEERYLAEKSRLEQEAVQVLRRKETAAAAAPVAPMPPLPPAGFFGRHPELKGAIWGAGIVLFFVGLGVLLTQEQRPRGEGDELTGNTRAAMPAPEPAPPQEDDLELALKKLREVPDDIEAASFASHELIRRQAWAQADQLNERTLGSDPFNVEARVHRAVLRATRGESATALDDLKRLADLYPGAHEALLFGGALAMQVDQAGTALEFFERFAVEAPRDEQPPQLSQAISELRQRLGR